MKKRLKKEILILFFLGISSLYYGFKLNKTKREQVDPLDDNCQEGDDKRFLPAQKHHNPLISSQ